MKNFFIAIAVAVIAYLIASPYLTIYQLRSAVESGDSEEISEHVDFATLRQNLKDQLNSRMSNAMSDDEENLGTALGAMLGGFIADRAIDAYVTPNGLASIMKGNKPGPGESNEEQSVDQRGLLEGADLGYDRWNRFSAAIAHDDGSETTFVLRRRGLSWMLTNVVLPG